MKVVLERDDIKEILSEYYGIDENSIQCDPSGNFEISYNSVFQHKAESKEIKFDSKIYKYGASYFSIIPANYFKKLNKKTGDEIRIKIEK